MVREPAATQIFGKEILGIKAISKETFLSTIETERKARAREMQTQKWNDDVLSVGNKTFSYRNINYTIDIIAYYTFDKPLDSRMSTNIGFHATLEYPEETKKYAKIADLVKTEITSLYSFLCADTNHRHQENWAIERMIEQMHKEAKEDIDTLCDNVPTILRRGLEESKYLEYLEELRRAK